MLFMKRKPTSQIWYFTDAAMEITEGSVAALLHDGEVTRATIESNNGGRGFARNVERILSENLRFE
jgi:hypothetical protein